MDSLKDCGKEILNKEAFDNEFDQDQLLLKEKSEKVTLQEGTSKITKEKFDLVFYHINKAEEEQNKETFNSILKITQVRHTNIIRYHDIYQWTEGEDIIIIIKQEWTKTTLDKILNDDKVNFSQWECLMGLFAIYDALNYLYSNFELHHGSINPHNILIDGNGNWKMSEFYHSQSSSKGSSTKIKFKAAGSNPSYYHSPKLQAAIADVSVLATINPQKEDIWSLGIILIRCIGKKKDGDIKELNIEKAESKKKVSGFTSKLGKYWCPILTKMCAFDEEERYDLGELKQDMTTLGRIDVKNQ